MTVICGRNSFLEAVKAGRDINKVYLVDTMDKNIARQIVNTCRQNNIPYQEGDKQLLERLGGADNRGIVADVAAVNYVEVADILAMAAQKGEPPLVVILSEVEDPHNLGAVMRTSLCAGVHGIIIPKRRSVQVNETVSRVSAGAAEYLPVARVANLVQTVEYLQQQGLWIAAADMDGGNLWQTDLKGPLGLVVGGEDKGIAPLLKSKCDLTVSIPMEGAISSLNVSNAAAVLLYEIKRQRS